MEQLRTGAVIVYPTDSAYALGCRIGDKAALDRIRAIRRLDERHNFTLVCRDLSELSTYAVVDNARAEANPPIASSVTVASAPPAIITSASP